MSAFFRDNRAGIAVLLAILAASRLWLAGVGIGPDPEILPGHWQHADLALLKTDYWRSLWFLHSQPPLWNAIIGIAVKLAGSDTVAATGLLHGLFILLSVIATLMLLAILRGAGLGPRAAAIWAGLIMVSPSVLYYENYIFYAHFTWFLCILFLFALQRASISGSLRAVTAALSVLAALSWTWALFHPVFVLICGAGVLWAAGRLRGLPALALLTVFTAISALPAAKNLVVTGDFTASSWMGMNLSQTALPIDSDMGRYCDLYLVHQEIRTRNPTPPPGAFRALSDTVKSTGHANLNHLGIAARGRECLGLSLRAIASRPLDWVQDGLGRIVASHRIPSFDYLFQPAGWDAFDPEALFDRVPLLGDLLALHFLILALWCATRALRGENRRFHLVLLMLIGWVTFVSHFANGHDYQRIRYTISPVYGLLMASLVQSALWSLRRVWTMRGPNR